MVEQKFTNRQFKNLNRPFISKTAAYTFTNVPFKTGNSLAKQLNIISSRNLAHGNCTFWIMLLKFDKNRR